MTVSLTPDRTPSVCAFFSAYLADIIFVQRCDNPVLARVLASIMQFRSRILLCPECFTRCDLPSGANRITLQEAI